MSKTIVVNMLGGPGSGKSTLSYGLMALLKSRGHKAEYVPEYAKEITYRRDWAALSNQNAVTSEQDRRLRDVLGQVDWIIHDTALPLGLMYAPEPYDQVWFADRVWQMFDGYSNFNIFVNRVKPYETYGRKQNEEEAKALDGRIRDLFGPDRIHFCVDGAEGNEELAYNRLMQIPR